MIYYWMVKCEIARLGIDAVRSLRERTLYSELSASSQWNSKGVKVTTRELQWSHLSCCSIPVWAPGDRSHPDQLRRSPTSCQSACRPHRRTRRWLEEAVWGQKSVIPPRIIPRSDSFLLADSSDCKKSIFIYELFRSYCIHPLKKQRNGDICFRSIITSCCSDADCGTTLTLECYWKARSKCIHCKIVWIQCLI